MHVRADAVTHEAATAVAADAAPAPAGEGIFLPPCSTTSPLPAAFCNILHRFSKPISGDAHASVNETCSKFQHGIARFKSMKIRSADEGKTMFYERQANAFAVLRDRCACVMLTCDVGQVEQEQREDCLLVADCRSHAPVQHRAVRCHSPRNAPFSGPCAVSFFIAGSGCRCYIAARCYMKFDFFYALLLKKVKCCTHENVYMPGVAKVAASSASLRKAGFQVRPPLRCRCRALI